MKTKIFLLLSIASTQLHADSLNHFLPKWSIFAKDTHSLQWLYDIAENNGFEKHAEVIKNKDYFIAALEGHIAQLETKLKNKSYGFSYKKMLIGLSFLSGSLSGLSHSLFVIFIDKDNRLLRSNVNFVSPAFYIILCPYLIKKAFPFIKKAFTARKELLSRLERDKRILEILKSA